MCLDMYVPTRRIPVPDLVRRSGSERIRIRTLIRMRSLCRYTLQWNHNISAYFVQAYLLLREREAAGVEPLSKDLVDPEKVPYGFILQCQIFFSTSKYCIVVL